METSRKKSDQTGCYKLSAAYPLASNMKNWKHCQETEEKHIHVGNCRYGLLTDILAYFFTCYSLILHIHHQMLLLRVFLLTALLETIRIKATTELNRPRAVDNGKFI